MFIIAREMTNYWTLSEVVFYPYVNHKITTAHFSYVSPNLFLLEQFILNELLILFSQNVSYINGTNPKQTIQNFHVEYWNRWEKNIISQKSETNTNKRRDYTLNLT